MTEAGTHRFDEDPRNEGILVYVNGNLVPRNEATISVFDSGFILGDGVWEGVRLHNGHFAFLERHLERLWQGARALDLETGVTQEELIAILHRTVEANGMVSGVHVRLMITRGLKSTPYQSPSANIGPPTIVIIPEYKRARERVGGIHLMTVHIRRGAPDVLDPAINSHSKLNCILACMQANRTGADEALMLDPQGFVATCNSTHFFVVRKGEIWTSSGAYCLRGITRGVVLELARENGIVARETTFPLLDVYDANEAFVTGTFGGITPVASVDGRKIGDSPVPGPVVRRLQQLYAERLQLECPPA